LDIVDAMVPILKIELLGYQFDLLYAAVEPVYLSSQQNLEKLIKDENFFNKLNQVSQNSFNGLRTS